MLPDLRFPTQAQVPIDLAEQRQIDELHSRSWDSDPITMRLRQWDEVIVGTPLVTVIAPPS